MDKQKLQEFISQALNQGHSPQNIADFVVPKLRATLKTNAQTNTQPTKTFPQPNPIVNSVSNVAQEDGDIFELIKKYFPQNQWDNALAVARGESGLNPNAIGDNYPIDTGNGPETIPSYGLFQIRGLAGRPPKERLLNPEFNVHYAADMFKQQGWRPWSVARKLGLI